MFVQVYFSGMQSDSPIVQENMVGKRKWGHNKISMQFTVALENTKKNEMMLTWDHERVLRQRLEAEVLNIVKAVVKNKFGNSVDIDRTTIQEAKGNDGKRRIRL